MLVRSCILLAAGVALAFAGCSDKNDKCCFWAATGECQRNTVWMAANCMKSCGTCDCKSADKSSCQVKVDKACMLTAGQVGVPSNPDLNPSPASASGSCPDKYQDCCAWQALGECDKNPFWMRVNCQSACGTCGCTIESALTCKKSASKCAGGASGAAGGPGRGNIGFGVVESSGTITASGAQLVGVKATVSNTGIDGLPNGADTWVGTGDGTLIGIETVGVKSYNSEGKAAKPSTIKTTSGKPANILLIVGDDMGFADVPWHDPNIKMPYLEGMMKSGILLNRTYTHVMCSNSRTQLMTGYDDYHIGFASSLFSPGEATCVPPQFEFMPERLRKAGYKTYMIGKWHLGYCGKTCIPTGKGFDHYDGYLLGGGTYNDHKAEQTPGAYDYWHNEHVNTFDNNTYTTDMFTLRGISHFRTHKLLYPDKPFFLYMSYQACHDPMDTHPIYMQRGECDKIPKGNKSDRRGFCGLAAGLDAGIESLIEELKADDMYDDTLIIFTSDNGGNKEAGASNFPLRGCKTTLWEGGTRVPAFVHAPKLLKGITGVRESLMHITDWYATILNFAGIPTATYGDGVNQYPMWVGEEKDIRDSFVYNIDTYGNSSGIRWQDWKLIRGNPAHVFIVNANNSKVADMNPNRFTDQYGFKRINGWYQPLDPQNSYRPVPDSLPDVMLFNIDKDPEEINDVADANPDIVAKMTKMMENYERGEAQWVHKGPDPKADPMNFRTPDPSYPFGFLSWDYCPQGPDLSPTWNMEQGGVAFNPQWTAPGTK